jgi:hypothetical protein
VIVELTEKAKEALGYKGLGTSTKAGGDLHRAMIIIGGSYYENYYNIIVTTYLISLSQQACPKLLSYARFV